MNLASQRRRSLITGGAGFIGSHLAENLVGRGKSVTVIDNLSTGRRSNLEGIESDSLTFIEGEVEPALPRLDPRDFDEIYHLAAAVGVRLVIERPVHTIRTNIFDTLAVLQFAARAGVPTLIASTSEVYGKGSQTPFAEDDDVVYGPTIYSRWSYGCSKQIDEYLALAFFREEGLPVVIARFFNTIGPRQLGRYGMVVPRFVRAALSNRPIEVYGDGRQTRCFCDVRDIVTVLPSLLSMEKCHGRVFNVGDDDPIEILALAEMIRDTLQSSSEVRLVPYSEAFGEGFDDLRHRAPDLTRLREMTGFRPTISLQQSIRDIAASLSTAGTPSLREGSHHSESGATGSCRS